jgi:predicted ATPase/DNA-binding CsgD family transcriptional regulator
VVVVRPASQLQAITAREREVWSLVARHLSNAEIAAELCVSVRTVESHVSSLIRKRQVADRRVLAREAPGSAEAADQPAGWPVPVTSFVGRDTERSELAAAIAAHRMVTVTGPGGVGKTRLAVEVGQQAAGSRRDGGWFVELAEVTDPAMVVAAVAAAVGVPERHGGSLDDALAEALAESDAVLVLDNCEHLIDAVRSCVERLMAACPGLAVVATSRIRLVAPYEWVYPVPGLSVTPDGGDAVTLFLARARAAGGGPDLDRHRVASVCQSLDGVALAIELAAARYPTLGLDGLSGALDHGLRVLTSGRRVGDRHRSMHDALAWSFDLLSPEDRSLLCAVAVFAGWFDATAAAALAGADVHPEEVADRLGRLADHNLLVAAPGDPTRYRALEIIRQYAAEQLTLSGQHDAVHERHRRWCHSELFALAGQPRDRAWCERLDRVAADARAALTSADLRRDAASAELAECLADQLLLRGYPAEAQYRYEQAAERHEDRTDRARLLSRAAGAAACRMVGGDALRLLRTAADEALAAGAAGQAAQHLAWMSIYTRAAPGIIAAVPGPEDDARTLAEAQALAAGSPAAEAAVATAVALGVTETAAEGIQAAEHAADLALVARVPLVRSAALDALCACHLARADYARALDTLDRREATLGEAPLDASSAFQYNDFLLMASEVNLAVGDLARAGAYADRLARLDCYREQDHLAIARRIKVDALAGDLQTAAARGERFAVAWQRAGRPVASNLASTAYAMATVQALLGDEARRREWVDVTLVLGGERPSRWLEDCTSGWAPTLDGLVALDRGRPDQALERLAADVDEASIWARWNTALWRPWYAAFWAEAALLAGRPDAPDRLDRARAATQANPIASAVLRRTAALAGGVLEDLPGLAHDFDALGAHYQRDRTLTLLDAATPT